MPQEHRKRRRSSNASFRPRSRSAPTLGRVCSQAPLPDWAHKAPKGGSVDPRVSDIGRIGVRIYNNTGPEIRTAVVAYAVGAHSNSPGAEAAGITQTAEGRGSAGHQGGPRTCRSLNRISRRSSPAARTACSVSSLRLDLVDWGSGKWRMVMGLTRIVLGPAPLSAGVYDLRLTRFAAGRTGWRPPFGCLTGFDRAPASSQEDPHVRYAPGPDPHRSRR